MNAKVCVNCHNEKPVNHTDNRLVTESCGHVKCMDCLLCEKSGCLACVKETTQPEFEDNLLTEVELAVDNESVKESNSDSSKHNDNVRVKQILNYDDYNKKKKLETSHIRIEIDGNCRLYCCTVCRKKFHARSQVAYHAYCNGQQKPYQCPECNKDFASQSHYKYHMRVHRNERTYSCEMCGSAFFQMSKLQRHKLKHTMEKKYICTECNKGFTNLTALRKHGMTHTEERPYKCSKCDRQFRDKSNLKKHIAKHDLCGRESVSHTRVHERRAHQCPRCPQAFHSRKDMRRHAQVHTDSKPFRCKVCNRRFRRKDNLERHIRNTHPDFVPASAVECDVNALKQMAAANGHSTSPPTGNTPDVAYETHEKTKLEILNPLPPLPQEVIQNLQSEKSENPVIDKSYILEANNARQSVIVAKSDKRPASPVTEYVHKIRKANSRNQKDGLPPIDEKKMFELNTLNNLDVAPLPNHLEVYKNILFHGKKELNSSLKDEGKVQSTSPETHWKRKMKISVDSQ